VGRRRISESMVAPALFAGCHSARNTRIFMRTNLTRRSRLAHGQHVWSTKS